MKVMSCILAVMTGLMVSAKENKMGANMIVFEKTLVVTGNVTLQTIPSNQVFAERGKPVFLGASPWDLKDYTGPISETPILIRAEFTAPGDGWYALGVGAEYWFKGWIDGKLVMDTFGNHPPAPMDHKALLQLKAGKHVFDINFGRGDFAAILALELQFLGADPDFGVDLTRQTGRLNKELHGSNTTLLHSSRAINKFDEELRKLNFSLSRTHDWALWNPGQRVVDTHFIFPLLKLDPKDPSNYFFDATDEMIRLTQEEGRMKVFFRLGTSIEHSEKHFNIIPPEDYEQYAEILAGIVRHYTRGWANGFRYDIRYWEIWNEPDDQHNMWAGDFEKTFVPFFVTVLKRLKSEFPELQFGGPAMCTANVYFRPLLKACKEAGIAPDFISWHCYTSEPDRIICEPVKMRKLLDEIGFLQTKLCINEWHYLENWSFRRATSSEEYRKALNVLQGIDSGVYNLAVLSGWQSTPLDLAMWYGAEWDSPAWGYRHEKEYTKNYYSMELYGRFLRDYPVKCSSRDFTTYLLAGVSEDGRKAGILVSDLKGQQTTLSIPVKGLEDYSKISAVILDETRNCESVSVERKDGKLFLKKAKPGSAAFLVMLEK